MFAIRSRPQLVLSLLAIVFAAAAALTPAPATAQTSQPSIVPGSPKEAVLNYDKALHEGDGPALRGLLATTNPTEDRVATVMVDTAVTMADLGKKARAKFGADSANAAFGDADEMSKRADDAVMRATETVNGDTAVVVANPGPQGTINLKKVDGKWKLSVTATLMNVNPANVQKTLDAIEKANAVMRQLSADVDAGKFTTAEEAKSALNERIDPVNAEIKQDMKAGPSTKPS